MSAMYVPFVVEALKEEKFKTVYELACGNGQILKEIAIAFPKAVVDGCDIEEKWGYSICDIESVEGEKYDIVILAATLLLFDDEHAAAIIANAKRMAKKLLLLVEPVKEGETIDNGNASAHRYQRDYSKYGVSEASLFKGWPAADVQSAVMKIRI